MVNLTPHPSWEIKDSTKFKSWKECKRKYFYEYLLGWKPTTPNNHLVFGEAWHKAMEVVYSKASLETNTLAEAYQAFVECYRKEFPESSDELYNPKTPDAAFKALIKYGSEYQQDFTQFKPLYVEVSGSVPISLEPKERRMYFRIDSLNEDSHSRIFSHEHKTKGGNFNRQWEDEFYLSIQIGTYTHAMYCLFPKERVRGVEINAAGFRKLKAGPEIDFKRIQCWLGEPQMNQWLYIVNDIWEELEENMEALHESSEDDSVMSCFAPNPTACTKYFGCPYNPFCCAWANPLQHIGEPPIGFEVTYWDPREMDTKHKVDLRWGEENVIT